MAKYIWIIGFACEVFYCWNKSSLWSHIVLLSQISFATLFCSLASLICPLYLSHFIFLIPVLFTLPDADSLMFSFLSSGYYVLHVKQSFFSPHSVTVSDHCSYCFLWWSSPIFSQQESFQVDSWVLSTGLDSVW